MLAARASANGHGSGSAGAPRGEDRYRDELSAYLRDVAAIPLLTADEERLLGERAALGDTEAAHRLVRSNLRLVVHLARGYVSSGLPLLDLIQDGNQGLMRATQKYEPARRLRFSTYAGWWIRQSILRGISRTKSAIRLPDYLQQRISALRRTEEEVRGREGREPTAGELAGGTQLSLEQLRRAQQSARRPASLDRLMRTKELARTVEKTFARLGQHDPFEAVAREELAGLVRQSLGRLPGRYREVLRMRFGLEGRRPRTLEDIGRKLGISRERVRQIEMRALEILRHSSAMRKLSTFAES